MSPPSNKKRKKTMRSAVATLRELSLKGERLGVRNVASK